MNNLLNDPAILRDIILDHYSYPRNKGLKTGDKYKGFIWLVNLV